MRTHNKLRRRVQLRESQRQRIVNERKFKRNPFGCAQTLFVKEFLNGVPSFNKETADSYFSSMYRDDKGDKIFEPLEDI